MITCGPKITDMKFSEIPYQQPDLESLKADLKALIDEFKQASDVETQNNIIKRFNDHMRHYSTQYNIASIRFSINTTDEKYQEARKFFSQTSPELQEVKAEFQRELIKSPFRKELEEKWGHVFLKTAELATKTISPEIIKEMQEENELESQYQQIMGAGKVVFQGEEKTLNALTPLMLSTDRSIRKEAFNAYYGFLEEKSDEIFKIYDKQVALRDSMASKLGFEDFVSMGYARMNRQDYGPDEVARFRAGIAEHFVPILKKLKESQKQRLGLDDFKDYDYDLLFTDGNATPKGEPEWILDQGKQMYRELSNETGEFFDMMMDNELLDVLDRKGKAPGGFCTFLLDYQSPFIFANFNGTSHDIDVLTHEAGHAFQTYMSRNHELVEYMWPTYEACEIHSMSMEFLTYPWMENFFGADEPKYKYGHLARAVTTMTSCANGDSFQEWIYRNPNASIEERNAKWAELEHLYRPLMDHGDNDFLNKGGGWIRIGHFFFMPFYYIDYALAEVCALQFWLKSEQDRSAAWADYVKLCKAGGSKSFLELVELAGLRSPFEEGLLEELAAEVSKRLERYESAM
jgi:M3 family oligoendopeptidase